LFRAGGATRRRTRLRSQSHSSSPIGIRDEWGDLPDAENRRLRSEVEADLLAIPGDTEKVVLFDRHRIVVQSLGDELAAATPEAIQQVVAQLVERVETADRAVVGWLPTGPAEPFFDSALLSRWRPRTDSGTRHRHETNSNGTRESRDGRDEVRRLLPATREDGTNRFSPAPDWTERPDDRHAEG
jgi:hypothetical protein